VPRAVGAARRTLRGRVAVLEALRPTVAAARRAPSVVTPVVTSATATVRVRGAGAALLEGPVALARVTGTATVAAARAVFASAVVTLIARAIAARTTVT